MWAIMPRTVELNQIYIVVRRSDIMDAKIESPYTSVKSCAQRYKSESTWINESLKRTLSISFCSIWVVLQLSWVWSDWALWSRDRRRVTWLKWWPRRTTAHVIFASSSRHVTVSVQWVASTANTRCSHCLSTLNSTTSDMHESSAANTSSGSWKVLCS